MLVDLHSHTSGISKCCRIDAKRVIECAEAVGIDGLAITNHYQKSYVIDGDAAEFAERYIEEYNYTANLGKAAGVKIFFGVEVTMEWNCAVHILIYGIDDDFIRDNPTMFEYSQQTLYKKVKEYGGAMIQAHPYRNGSEVIDISALDGVEINCHPMYKNSYSDELLAIAGKNNLTVTCGGDFHADTYRAKCGVYIPNDFSDGIELGKYISEAETVQMCVQEPNEEQIKEITYYRNGKKPNVCCL